MDRLFRTRLKADAAEAQLQAHQKRVAWRTRVAGVSLPTLRNRRDWQSLAYLAALPALAAWQWVHGFWWPLYALMLFLTLGIGVIHHNHTHLRMWRGRWANRATDFWITLLQGHPTFVFYPAHVANHHRYKHGPDDQARTYRFGGDTNHLWGYLIHPAQAVWVLYPLFFTWLAAPALARRLALLHGAVRRLAGPVGGSAGAESGQGAGVRDRAAAARPALAAGHNYLQHAHADGGPGRGAALSYARNFEGLLNPLLFNIGLHTAHHEHSRAHWAELTELHYGRYRDQVPAALNEGGLVPYMFRVSCWARSARASVPVPAWRPSTSARPPRTSPEVVMPIAFHRVYLESAGYFMPGEPVSNDDMDRYIAPLNRISGRIKQRILAENGIKQRHYAIGPEGETVFSNAQLAANAIRDCLRRNESELADVSMLASGSSGGDALMPGFANMIQGEMAAHPMETLSVHGICAAGVSAIQAAAQGVELGHASALAVASELPSRLFAFALRRARL